MENHQRRLSDLRDAPTETRNLLQDSDPQKGSAPTSVVWIAAFFCALGAFAYSSLGSLVSEVRDNRKFLIAISETLIEQRLETAMQSVTTTWTDAQGVTHSVTTVRQEGETDQQLAARHRAAVEALQQVFPPVGR